jgi:hypothetical protein
MMWMNPAAVCWYKRTVHKWADVLVVHNLMPSRQPAATLGSLMSSATFCRGSLSLPLWFVDGFLLERRGRAVTLQVKEGNHKLILRALARHNADVTIRFFTRTIER